MKNSLLFICLLTVLLSACGNTSKPSPPPTGDLRLSGVVYAPAGHDISGTIVFACYLAGGGCDEDKSQSQTISQAGVSAQFSLSGLEDHSYYLVALKDTNGNGEFDDDGDLYAEIAEQLTPPMTGLELRMERQGNGTDPGNPGEIPAVLLGEWFTGSISSIQFYDPVSGSWADPNGEGFYLILHSDGSYEEGAVINSTQYNCSIRLLGRAVGTFTATSDTLTLNQIERRTHVFNSCSGVGDRVIGPETTNYGWEIKNDSNGNRGLFLSYNNQPYATFYPWK